MSVSSRIVSGRYELHSSVSGGRCVGKQTYSSAAAGEARQGWCTNRTDNQIPRKREQGKDEAQKLKMLAVGTVDT